MRNSICDAPKGGLGKGATEQGLEFLISLEALENGYCGKGSQRAVCDRKIG